MATEHHFTSSTQAGFREWLGLAALAIPTFLIAIDVTVLHLAIPAITEALSPTQTEVLWIVDIYGFMISGLLICMGIIGDRIGRRKLLMMGALGFAMASLIAAFAFSPMTLIMARALLGITAATLMPSTLSLISNMFLDKVQRGFAIAVWSSAFMTGAAAGPLIGGALLEYFWWGSVFLINVPLAFLLIATAPFLLPEYKAEKTEKIDFQSICLFFIGILTMIYGIKLIVSHSWLSLKVWIFIFLGLYILFVFAKRQSKLIDPMLDFSLFKSSKFSAAITIQTFAIFAIGAPYFLGAQYFQLALGLSPLKAGLCMLPSTVVGILSSLVASKSTAKIRPAYIITIALIIGSVGLLLLTQIESSKSLIILISSLALATVGSSATTALTINIVVSAAPKERTGEASGLSETSGELGMAVGIAITGSISAAVYRLNIISGIPKDQPADLLISAQNSYAAFISYVAGAKHPPKLPILDIARSAFEKSLASAGLVGAVLMLCLAAISFLILTKDKD